MERQKNEKSENDYNSIYDESENDIIDTKKTIIKLFEDQIKEKKESFMNLSIILQRKEQIQRLSQNLKLDIKNLEQIISDLLDRQKDDYLNAFSQFMDSIKKNLSKQLEEMEKAFEEKRKTNDIRIIRCERDFFKSEAIRLNNLCKKLKEELEDINFKYKLLKVELINIKIKYKESENINKKLLSDIESKIIENNKSRSLVNKKINIKKQINSLSINNYFNTENINNNSKMSKNSKNISYLNIDNSKNEKEKNLSNISIIQDVSFLNNLLRRSKNEIKKEKNKANKAIAELSKIYLEKNKLENIFQNCVEETKKIIFNRKIMENKFYKIKNGNNLSGLFKYDLEHRINFSTKFEEFLPSDKQKTLEKFIFDDEVYNIVKDIIFKFPKIKQERESKINMMNSLHFSGTESKLYKISDISNIKQNKKTIDFLPLMKNKKLSFINTELKNEDFHRTRALTINK